MKELSKLKVQHFKYIYPPGTSIIVDNMPEDRRPIASGNKGKVIAVDDIGTIHCAFENGSQPEQKPRGKHMIKTKGRSDRPFCFSVHSHFFFLKKIRLIITITMLTAITAG